MKWLEISRIQILTEGYKYSWNADFINTIINPLTPTNDEQITSPYNIHALSSK